MSIKKYFFVLSIVGFSFCWAADISEVSYVDQMDKILTTYVMNSVEKTHLYWIKQLYQDGYDLNEIWMIKGRKDTLLHTAVRLGHLKVIHWLCNHKIKLDVQNSCGNTPAHVAALYDHIFILYYLLELGANPYYKNHQQKNVDDLVPCMYKKDLLKKKVNKACLKPQHVNEMLFAEVKIKNFSSFKFLHEEGGRLDSVKNGVPLLHEIVLHFCFDMLTYCLEHKVDINQKNTDGQTALEVLLLSYYQVLRTCKIEQGNDSLYKPMVLQLLDCGARIDNEIFDIGDILRTMNISSRELMPHTFCYQALYEAETKEREGVEAKHLRDWGIE